MDRTAWIAISLCVIGLVAWEFWIAKQTPRNPSPALVSSPTPAASPIISPSAVPAASAAPIASATPAPSAMPPAFAEKNETLRNADVELRLTNRGGGIAEAVLLNHTAQGDQRVVLNSKNQAPIGAIIEQPGAGFDEFKLSREPDGAVKAERNANGLVTRKKFFFPPGKEKKDNFIAEMDVDLVNSGAQPDSNPGYFVALGSAGPIHPAGY